MKEIDPMLSTAISFVISYIANCLPVPTTDYEGHLRKCFHNALDRWTVAQEIKDSARNDMDKYLIGLREIVTHTSKGRHPKECELLLSGQMKYFLTKTAANSSLPIRMRYFR